jgi:endonuclease/exonuclease/phosphatase (EEP) superfamily protein YafD
MRSLRQLLLWFFELAVLGVAAGCGIAAVASQGGRWNDRLDLLTHFTPVWLAGGVVSLLVALWWRPSLRKFTAIGFALAAVISAGAIMAPDLIRRIQPHAPPSTQRNLKVIEFNAWKMNDDPARVAQWLAQENPDVAVIIEPTSALQKQIVGATGMHMFEGSGALIFTREKPVAERVAWDARELPGAPTELTWVDLPGPDGRPFSVMGVHTGWPIPARQAWGQGRKMAAVLQTLDRTRVIFVGDFNSTQWSFRQRAVDASFAIERRDHAILTWPARLPMARSWPFPVPFLSIDHAYAGPYWKTVRIARGPRMGSDHYPLVMTFAWSPPTRRAARD